MGAFYKPYPKEFYAINDLLKEQSVKKLPPMVINTIDFTNRCVNYTAIDPVRTRFTEETARNIIRYLGKHADSVVTYIKDYFPEPQAEEAVRIIQEFAKKDPDYLTHEDKVELHYHLVDLYHYFPNNPYRHVDGILRKIETWLSKRDIQLKYATVDSLPKEECPFEKVPWVRMRFYGEHHERIKIAIDQHGHDLKGDIYADEIVANQEDLSILKECRDWISSKETREEMRRTATDKDNGNEKSKIFFNYLFPLFIDPTFKADKEREGAEHLPGWPLIVMPIYSGALQEGYCGTVMGHLNILFENRDDRDAFCNEIDKAWNSGLVLIPRTLLEGRAHMIGERDFRFHEGLKDFLDSITHVQDWERIMVFGGSQDGETMYCFKRFSGKEKGQQVWNICENQGDCKKCENGLPLGLIEALQDYLGKKQSPSSRIRNTYHEPVHDTWFFFQRLDEILDPKILPSIENGDIARYKNYVLCFQFPECTFYRTDNNRKENAVRKLGEHYTDKLIPVFDRILMKRKVLKHAIKSAVAAIVSRNHSHHIGSHVIPRVDLEKVIARLDHLGYQDASFEKKAKIAGSLKSRLDQYIQKKADFLSEIVTEPLTTTRTLGFFNGVILPLVQNTLLMDNIGANEGVNYRKGIWNDNRLRIHVYFEDQELKAKIWGGTACTCDHTSHTPNYPYSGHCKCPAPLELKDPEQNDVSVALPGPLGEFALYAFLENFIRNAVKHNQETFRKNPDLNLDVHIKLAELPEDDPQKDDFYGVEVWEDVTPPALDLLNRLNGYIDEPVIDGYGQLKKGAWGVTEMKIMANLMRGSDDFSTMESSLHVRGEHRLVYEFRMMKPKEIAVISRAFSLSDDHKKKGIRSFHSLEDFVKQQKEARSLAGFNFVILDRDGEEQHEDFSHFLPNRVFLHHSLKNPINGSVRIDDRFMESIRRMDPDAMISFAWQSWIKSLPALSEEEKNLRITIFLGQEVDSIPTEDWHTFAKEPGRDEKMPGISIIFQGDDKNEVFPAVSAKDRLAVFDRHFSGFEENEYGQLRKDRRILFHEALDKNSSDFVPIFSTRPSESMVFQLAESALLKVLVLDERLAEIAYDKALIDEENKPLYLYDSTQRIEVCRWANIYIATHLKIDDQAVKTLHYSIQDEYPQIHVEATMGSPEGNRIDEFKVYWIGHEKNGAFERHEIIPHAIIMHQGVLETFFGDKIPRKENESFVEALKDFVCSLRGFIPFVVVDSGRGIPANLPPDLKFMPFSLIEEFFMQERISKHSLIKTLMGLTRRGSQ